MARDLDLPIRIVTVPTVREADGLALSSRNRGLTPAQRTIAPRLHETLDLRDRAAPGARLFAAAWLGDIRLIDNIAVG